MRGQRFKSFENLDHLIEVVKICRIKDKYKYGRGAFECEFFATQMMASVWDYQYNVEVRNSARLVDEIVPWFFGNCLGMRFKTYDGNHNINIAFAAMDIALYDAGEDVVWLPGNLDDPYFIFR